VFRLCQQRCNKPHDTQLAGLSFQRKQRAMV
jgi:hypothetical protein